MPYQGSNAEYLNKMCLYDLLCKMNSNIEDANAHGETPCIMNALTGKTDIARCQSSKIPPSRAFLTARMYFALSSGSIPRLGAMRSGVTGHSR